MQRNLRWVCLQTPIFAMIKLHVLRFEKFSYYNQFSWNACCAILRCNLKTFKLCLSKKELYSRYIQTGNFFLHISMGGLGIRKASEVAVPAYLSSVCATSTGVEAMVSNTIFGENNPFVELAFLESGINVPPWINIVPEKFVKQNKCSPIYTLLYYSNRLYEVWNKAVSPGKKSKK